MTNSMSKNLPDDIVTDILSRLPVKPLIRFMCVSKLWYAKITHPSFITMHLNRVHSYDHGHVQHVKYSSGKQTWSLLSDQRNVNHVEWELSYKPPSKPFEIVGTVNGLVFLSDISNFGLIYLWNPSIQKFKTLPGSAIAQQHFDSHHDFLFGFGFHHQTNDYKVVRVLYSTDFMGNYIAESPAQGEVYTLSTNSWRRIEAVPCFPCNTQSDAFVNGSFHWFPNRMRKNRQSDKMLTFDIGDEEFREMKPPNNYNDGVAIVYSYLAVLKDSLSLCLCFPFENFPRGRCDLWVMKEYGVVDSWTKLFTIAVPHGIVARSFGFTRKNELLLETEQRDVVFYDLESRRVKSFVEISRDDFTFSLTPFKETLVLLEEKNAMFDGVCNEGICLRKMKSGVVDNPKQKRLEKGKVKNSTSRAVEE